MASTGEAANVDSTGEVDAEALARDAGGGDAPSCSTKGAVRVVDKATQTVSTVDKAAQTDPLVEDTGECLRTRLLAIICWLVGMGVVLWTQMEWISKETSTGSAQDSFLVISLLLLFSIGVIMFLQEVFESLTLLKTFRKAVEGRDSWDAILLLKEIVFIPISALGAWGLWILKWSNFVYKICRSNGVGSILVAALMNDFNVVDDCRMSVGIYGKADSNTSLCFVFVYTVELTFATVVHQMVLLLENNSPQPPSKELKSEVTEGHQEEPKNSSGRFQVPREMLAVSLLQAIVFYSARINFWLALRFDARRRHEFWRFLTVSLVHLSSRHLWGNICHTLLTTSLLQVVHSFSPRSVVGIFVLGNFGGTFAASLLRPGEGGVGASAGIFALRYAFFFTFVLKAVSKLPPAASPLGTPFARFVGPQLFSFLWMTLLGLGVLFHFHLQCVFTPDGFNIGHEAHFGGALAGILGAMLVYFKDTPEDVTLKNAVKVYAGILVLGVLGVNVFLPGNYLKTEWHFDYLQSYVRERIRQHRVYVDVNGTCRSPCAYNAIRSLNWTGGWDAPYTNNFNPFFCRK